MGNKVIKKKCKTCGQKVKVENLCDTCACTVEIEHTYIPSGDTETYERCLFTKEKVNCYTNTYIISSCTLHVPK